MCTPLVLILFSAIHDQGSENVCWAYAISTMLRASIRSALKKLKIKRGYISEHKNIKHALKIIANPNHHKMMRKELVMNIFPFGDDGTDPSIIIKLVCYRDFTEISKFRNLDVESNNLI